MVNSADNRQDASTIMQKDNASRARSYTKMNDDNAKSREEEINQAKVYKLKAENEFRIEALAKVHLLELEDVKQKNNNLWRGYQKEVNELKH